MAESDLVDIVARAVLDKFLERDWEVSDPGGSMPLHQVATPVARKILNTLNTHGAWFMRNYWREHMRACLGRQVAVTISRDPEPVIVKGQLLSFDEAGEVVLRDEDGFIRWCWPNLETVAA